MPASTQSQRRLRTSPPTTFGASKRGAIFLAALIIVLSGLAAYSNSLHGPFILDDTASITENPTIQHGWLAALHPPTNGETVMGRPLVNLSLALNYSTGGRSVAGYHAVNLAIHLLAGLVLFGLVRRTLELSSLQPQFSGTALFIAGSAALWWTVHPLQTESVTYVVQRAEVLMGLFYLLTLYCFVRGTQKSPRLWFTLAVLACLLGGLCKEVIVTAPVLVFLYDRTFIARSFKEAWRARHKFYGALGATWLPLGWMVWSSGTRGDSAGYGTGVNSLDYALAQAPAILNYLRLSIWPTGLVFDYGRFVDDESAKNTLAIALVIALLAGTLWALWRRPGWGFAGAWFFIILAPSSSVVPIITEVAAEHRMYLPLAAWTTLTAVCLWKWAGRVALPTTVLLTLALGLATWKRNEEYREPERLWRNSLAGQPNVARAHENLGLVLAGEGREPDAIMELRTALRLRPDYPEGENNLGEELAKTGALDEAAQYFAKAVQGFKRPQQQAMANFNLGNTLGLQGKFPDALAAYTRSAELQPDFAPAQHLRGYVLDKLNRDTEAVAAYQSALKLQPDFPQCETNLGVAYAKLGRWPEAVAAFENVLRENPDFAPARAGLEAARQQLVPAR